LLTIDSDPKVNIIQATAVTMVLAKRFVNVAVPPDFETTNRLSGLCGIDIAALDN
jgi:hypothetical protein